jgi:hypothetical protein
VADDWRVTIELEEGEHVNRILAALREREVRQELRDELGGRVAVSSDGPHLFLYADTRRAAEAGERALGEVLEEHDLHGTPRLDRWHPIEERWEDASVPEPQTPSAREIEHDRREALDTADSLATGVAQWEVRVELGSHDDAQGLADRLEAEGRSVTRRATYVLVGANDEDDAKQLAQQIEAVAPAGATVQVEPGSGVAWQLLPNNPFAIFGGLAG